MDLDRALWQQCESGERAHPFLRVYGWSKPCLSLGYHQELSPEVASRARAHGLDVVRRPTGGAAVLHAQEMTYCLTAPQDESLFGRRVAEIYDRVAAALVRALAECGVSCDRGGGGRPTGFACFSAAGGHEITVEGRKLVGSALRRGRHAFLQHGSLLTGPGHLDIADIMAATPEEAERQRRRLQARTVDLSQIPGALRVDPARFGAALARALGASMGEGRDPA
jgi:lipoate-protein ligase A